MQNITRIGRLKRAGVMLFIDLLVIWEKLTRFPLAYLEFMSGNK